MVPFSFAGQDWFIADGLALLHGPTRSLLVADLHLEKASFYARHGQMLPPYDSRDTLKRLDAIIAATGAQRIYCLGDNFHDDAGEDRLEPQAAEHLMALTRRHDWLWIAGNHDEGVAGQWGGQVVDEAELAGIALRHKASPARPGAEISGHFHPCITRKARGRSIRRRCFVRGDDRLILPAFGTLTGSMAADDSAIRNALGQPRLWQAVLSAQDQCLIFDLA